MKEKRRLEDLTISPGATLIEALRTMDKAGHKLLLVMEAGRFVSVVSIGDVQRGLLKGVGFEAPVREILRRNITIGRPGQPAREVERMMLDQRMEFLPVVDEERRLAGVVFWEDVIGPTFSPGAALPGTRVVIIAGGQGVRLRPLTYVIPKALIPVTEKPIIHEIIDRFRAQGAGEFLVSVNYKGDMIERYFSDLGAPGMSIRFLYEDSPTGTIGSLRAMRGHLGETFFVTNCDILVEQDYGMILDYHRSNRNIMTLVSAVKNVPIPYGILETREDNLLAAIREKPTHVLQVNAGMYVLEPGVLGLIPPDGSFDVTQLIEALQARGDRIGVFPITERSWMDIGEWSEYLRTQRILRGDRIE